MSEWQPIETAPTDTELLLFAKVHMALDNYTADFLSVGMLETWYTHEWVDHDGEPLSFIPTHWMPLPKPPKLEEAE